MITPETPLYWMVVIQCCPDTFETTLKRANDPRMTLHGLECMYPSLRETFSLPICKVQGSTADRVEWSPAKEERERRRHLPQTSSR